jgi:YD repeat-containing protein
MRGSRLLATVSGGALAFAACAAAAQQQSTEAYQYDALGRVISAKTGGGTNNDETHSICYDAAGNRVKYKTTTNGTAATCASQGTQGGAPTPSPSPSPSPTPSNSPPATAPDTANMACDAVATVNLTANDTDPESNYPLALTAINGGGTASATIVSASSVSVDAGPVNGTSSFTYTVADSLGVSSTGTLTVNTTGCGNF